MGAQPRAEEEPSADPFGFFPEQKRTAIPFPLAFFQLSPWPPPSVPHPEQYYLEPAVIPYPFPGLGLQLSPPTLSSSLDSLVLLLLLLLR